MLRWLGKTGEELRRYLLVGAGVLSDFSSRLSMTIASGAPCSQDVIAVLKRGSA